MTVAAARRRALDLARAGEPTPAPLAVAMHARLVEHVTLLAVPVDAAKVAAALPALGLVVLATATGLLGLVRVVTFAVALVVLAGALQRGAPRRRAAATERALPGVLDAVARQLRAGGSLAQAITTVRPPPGASDLCSQWDRLSALVPVIGATAALDDWSAPSGAVASRSRSISLAAAALALASTTGGSPARAIDGVAATLRSRLAVSDEIRALSSQARASAIVIAFAPLVFGVLGGATDGRSRAFLTSRAGGTFLVVGVVLDGIGAWWMARLCRPPES